MKQASKHVYQRAQRLYVENDQETMEYTGIRCCKKQGMLYYWGTYYSEMKGVQYSLVDLCTYFLKNDNDNVTLVGSGQISRKI